MKWINLTLLIIGLVSTAWAAEPINTLEKSGLWGYKPSGIAIRGFDTVAYFTQGQAVEGNPSISTEWRGATWQFASEQHRDLFIASPEQYAPQYGGYCAYAVAMGSTAKIDPGCWKVVDGKLYLNFDPDIQAEWEANQDNFIAYADSNWPDVIK